jgi:hypothetical protein
LDWYLSLSCEYCFLTLCVVYLCYLKEVCTDDGCTSTKFSTVLQVWSDEETATLRDRAQKAFALFLALLASENGIGSDAFKISVEKSIDPGDGTGVNNIQSGTNAVADEGLTAGGAVGIAAGCLALLLLLVLLVRRRRDSDEVSHLKLEEEGEATFIHELDSASQPSNEYSPKNVHVVGEEDSIFSGWTGYPAKDAAFSDDHSEGVEGILGQRHGDVHACASATCEVCERRRQQGLQFIATGSPPRPGGLPSDAARDYVAEDTVEL